MKPRYEIGDVIINMEFEGYTYEIMDIDDGKYKYKVITSPNTYPHGHLDWCEFVPVEEVTRKLTKLDKALK